VARNKSESEARIRDIPDKFPKYDDEEIAEVYAHQHHFRDANAKPKEGKHGTFRPLWDFGFYDEYDWKTLGWPAGTVWRARGFYVITHSFEMSTASLDPSNHLGQPLDWDYIWAPHDDDVKPTGFPQHGLPGSDQFSSEEAAVQHFCDTELSELDLRYLTNSHGTQQK